MSANAFLDLLAIRMNHIEVTDQRWAIGEVVNQYQKEHKSAG
jgi:hypothetical protein